MSVRQLHLSEVLPERSCQERVLIRGLNWLGDSVMSLPAVELLRHAYPEAHISILVPQRLAGFWRPHLVDSVMLFDNDETLWQVARRLRAGRFTMGVALPLSLRSALEMALAGIPRRIGYDHRGRGVLLTERIRKPAGAFEMHKRTPGEVQNLNTADRRTALADHALLPLRSHHVFRHLALVSALASRQGISEQPHAPSLDASDKDAEAALRRHGLEPGRLSSPLFGMCPGAEYGPTKRWPEERFIEAARRIRARTNCRWAVIGSEKEKEVCRRIAEALTAKSAEPFAWSLAGKTALNELVPLLQCCSMVLTNDTGPMHVAAAAGTPVIGLFSSTSPELTGPGLPGDDRHRLLRSSAPCSPCFLKQCPIDMKCMESLDVARVVHEALAMHDRLRLSPL